jgi:arylsulfatase A-like enzyme
LLDVAPTICTLARLDCPPAIDGSTLPGVTGGPQRNDAARTLFAASAPARRRYACPWLPVPGLEGRWTAAIVEGRKLIRMPTRAGATFRAFDLRRDPLELVDRYDHDADAALALRLEEWSATAAAIDSRRLAVPAIADDVARELEELGYLE